MAGIKPSLKGIIQSFKFKSGRFIPWFGMGFQPFIALIGHHGDPGLRNGVGEPEGYKLQYIVLFPVGKVEGGMDFCLLAGIETHGLVYFPAFSDTIEVF